MDNTTIATVVILSTAVTSTILSLLLTALVIRFLSAPTQASIVAALFPRAIMAYVAHVSATPETLTAFADLVFEEKAKYE